MNLKCAIFLKAFLVMTFAASAQFQDSLTVTDATLKRRNFDTATNESKQLILSRNIDQEQEQKLRKDGAFWYVNTSPVHEKMKPPSESLLNKIIKREWFRNLMWLSMIAGFIAVMIWFLASSNVKLFRKKSANTVIADNSIKTEDIFVINYDQEIDKAINIKNYPMAIRLMYLQLLKDLSLKKIIQYKQEKTNNDYVMQLYKTAYYTAFFQLTRHFEYTWYGQFEVKTEAFKIIRADFADFIKTLS